MKKIYQNPTATRVAVRWNCPLMKGSTWENYAKPVTLLLHEEVKKETVDEELDDELDAELPSIHFNVWDD